MYNVAGFVNSTINPRRFHRLKERLTRIFQTYLGTRLDYRVRLFNVLAFIGASVSIASALVALISGDPWFEIVIYLAYFTLSVGLIIYAAKTQKYQRCYKITIAAVFLIGFPLFFFVGSGYYGAMPYFFIFAVAFTVFMLEGKAAVLMPVLELAVYTGISVYAYYYMPVNPKVYDGQFILVETLFGFLVVGVSIGFAMYIHFRLYNEQKKKLAEQNKMKTEFLQDIKHEIQNPLQIISLGTGIVSNYMEGQADAATAQTALTAVENEALRLGRMINGMVELATVSESPMSREKLDFAALLRKCCDASRLQMKKNHIDLRLEIAPDLPFVYAENEQLERVPVNLLQNALNSTKDGEITVEATADKRYITVRISDTGEGITDELLPLVFERGVSGRGGKGYGLYMCRTIVEAHGGTIKIESEPGGGTAVTFTIPVYGGQSEVSTHATMPDGKA